METFWLLGRKDMAEANDSMVCKFMPRKKKPGDKKKKPPKKKKESKENVSNLKIEEKESSVGKSTSTLNADSTPSSRQNSISGFIAHNLGKLIGGSGGTNDQDKGKHGNKRNSFDAGVTGLMRSIPLIMGFPRQNLKDNGTDGGNEIPPSNGKNVMSPGKNSTFTEAQGNGSQNTGQKCHEVVQMITVGHDTKEKECSCDKLSNGKKENRIRTKDVDLSEIIEPIKESPPLPVGSQIVRISGKETNINDIITSPLYQKKSEGQSHQRTIDNIEFSHEEITQEHGTQAKVKLPRGTALNQNFVLKDIGDTASFNNSLPPHATSEDTMHQHVKRSSTMKVPLGPESVSEQKREWTNSEDILSKDANYPNNNAKINGQVNDRTDPQEETLLTNQGITVKHSKRLVCEEVSGQKVLSNANSLLFPQASQLTSSSVAQLETSKTRGDLYSYNYSLQEGAMSPNHFHIKDDKVKKDKKLSSIGQKKNSHFAVDMTDC